MLVFKLLVSVGIVSIATYIGILKAKKLKDREHILREMVTFLGLVENEIRYMLSILPNAYEVARIKLTTPLKIAMGNIVVDMLAFQSDGVVDQSIVRNISELEGLVEYDKNIFISTLKNLGRSDLDGQINIIQNGISILENQIKEANEIKLTNSKMYKTIGAIAGIMLVVIFI